MSAIRFPVAKRGSTYDHTFDFSLSSGSITGCTLRMMVKRYSSDPDDAALVNIDNDTQGGLSIINATSPCKIRIVIPDDVMATLPAKDLVAGIQIELPDGTTIEVGEEDESLDPTFEVRSDVVHATASP